jgi:hypothetical protein
MKFVHLTLHHNRSNTWWLSLGLLVSGLYVISIVEELLFIYD